MSDSGGNMRTRMDDATCNEMGTQQMRRLAAAAFIVACVCTVMAQEEMQLTGFSVPFYDSDGTLTHELFGDRAVIRDEIADITNMKIDFYDEGKVNMQVTAPRCTYNRDEEEADSESSVRIVGENITVTGEGFSWREENQRFEIYSRARVVLVNLRQRMEEGEE